jgi:hypothetical protein
MKRCVLVLPTGPARRVGPSGIFIGRQHDCDIVIDAPELSRRHAHVRLTQDGAEIVPLGRGPLVINGAESRQPRPLADGDQLTFGTLVLAVMLREEAESAGEATGYVLERSGGGSFGIVTSPFALGGGERDDLIVASWPERAIELYVAQGELFVQARVAGAAIWDRALELDEPIAIAEGDLLAFGDETFTVRYFGAVAPTTKVKRGELPTRVVIQILPRGGRLVFTAGGREHEVLLADRRLDLFMALLKPPAEYAAGDFIPDDVVRAVVWPRNQAVSRPEINTLISRCRRDLVNAGLAGPRLLERSPNGGATRVALAPGAVVDVRG